MYIGDGAKIVRDAFKLAKEKAPTIIFIDELDAIGTKRFDSEKSGDREVQRTMLELLNQVTTPMPLYHIPNLLSLMDSVVISTLKSSLLQTDQIFLIQLFSEVEDSIERLNSLSQLKTLECRSSRSIPER